MIHRHFMYVKICSESSTRLIPVFVLVLEMNIEWFLSQCSVLCESISALIASRMDDIENYPYEGRGLRLTRCETPCFAVVIEKRANFTFRSVVTLNGKVTSKLQTSSFILEIWLFPFDPLKPYAPLPIDI